MKVLVVLSILGLVAAEPQHFLPYTTPLVTPAFRTIANSPVIGTYTANYPYTGSPSLQAALPNTYSYPFIFSPFVSLGGTTAGTTVVSNRQKRSADPEPKADPALLYTTGITTPAISGYQWSTNPSTSSFPYNTILAAVTVYSSPRTTTQLPYNIPFVNPYSNFPFWTTFTTNEAGKPIETTESRTKRSADPQVLTTGFTGFNYPTVNTRTTAALTPTALTYSNFPGTTFPGWSHWPTIYTNTFPFAFGNVPVPRTYIATN
ncbi:hypothetical protein SK128_016510 [Halocaridina rubra]|uniref:Uncharacterized protein n=1 Tax=Halocaridina rubra TaxID=373956 RepID=A0AAN9ADU7_HALRR